MRKSHAVRLFGSQSKLAEALGISRASVSEWGAEIPELRAFQIREILAKRKGQKGRNGAVAHDDAAVA